ncbi:plasma kallikrein-like isoform X2 [Perca fluviatilis]|uniref:plasma kallikrein-like isoform X2 n=1 Tax=Perca fluviatilis TaxID=8168 RepID=UPI001965FF15|nr:plasma kallikrein-like isoform X2 [Perca fluviatilis]
MGTHLILVGLLSLCSLSFGQDCNQQLLENVDFPGNDVTSLFSPDVEHCQQLCTQHSSCDFFTFFRADWNKDDRNFFCLIKAAPNGQPTAQAPLQGVTSGFSLKPCSQDLEPCLSKVYQNVDFFGADYRALFTADSEECQRACTQDPACQFFTFINEAFKTVDIRNKCHLKFSWPVPRTPVVEKKTGATSGFSQITQISEQSVCQGKLFPNTDIPGNDVEVIPAASPEHCQALCSAHSVCTYFSFNSNDFKCYMKNNNNNIVTKAKDGVTSGLPARFCQLDNAWVQVIYENVAFPTSVIRSEPMDDADTCQRTCTQDPYCQFYSYTNDNFNDPKFPRRHCFLKRTITMPAPPKVAKLANVVSGFQLRNCNSKTTV